MRRWLVVPVAALALVAVAVALPGQAQGLSLFGSFDDDNGQLFEADIDAIAAAGITKGCNPPANTRYCPDEDVDRGQMAAFLRRAFDLPRVSTDYFTDDDASIFEDDINAIAAAGITKGCNPPSNTRYCPDDSVDRGQMAAFLRRARGLPRVSADYFTDDDISIFEDDINAIAAAGITKGCNPPSNTRYCPGRVVSRGEMAAFLRRALDLALTSQRIPVGTHPAMICSKDRERCSLTVDLSSRRPYVIQEGLFLVDGATAAEQAELEGSKTSFTLTLDGDSLPREELSLQTDGGVTSRYWRSHVNFSSGTHTLIGRWRWDGRTIQVSTITIRADG